MSKNILNIEKGAIITRVQKAENNDRSYMGDKLKFIGIANRRIYFQSLEEHMIRTFGADRIFDVGLDMWEQGWDYYVDPQTLLNSLEDRHTLEMRLEKALETEDYFLAEKIRKQLNK